MSKKINVDYFRNKLDKLPQVQLPKIKSRKIFSTKGPGENAPPPLPKEPPPTTVVDRAPVTISTISQMVDGAPTYDYSFGGARVSEEVMERHQREDDSANNQAKEDDKPAKTNLNFSQKLTKHYKEMSDFKFKNILGKKTVVKTTMIQVDDYKQRYEEEKNEHTSDHSDYDFDVDSLPDISANPSRRGSDSAPAESAEIQSRRGSETASLRSVNPSRRGSESPSMRAQSFTEIRLKSESFNNLDDLDELEEVPPNDSSLYRIKEHADLSGSTVAVTIDQESPTKETTPTPAGKRSHRKMFDNACGRAKKAVNSKLQKLKQLRTKNQAQDQTHDQQEAPPKVPTRKPTCKRSVKKQQIEAAKRDSSDSVPSAHSEQESLGSSRDASLDFIPPRPEWVAKRILSTEPKDTPRCLRSQFKAQYSAESYDSGREIITTRPAPPPPVAKLQQSPTDDWGSVRRIANYQQPPVDEWGPPPPLPKPAAELQQLPEDEWHSPPVVTKLKRSPVQEWGPPPPLPKLQQPSLEEWVPESPLPSPPLHEWGPAPTLPKMHQLPPDEWGPAPSLTKLHQPSLEEEWGPTSTFEKLQHQPPPDEWGPAPFLLQQPSLDEEWGPASTLAKLQHQPPPTEWGPVLSLRKLQQPSLEEEWGPLSTTMKLQQQPLDAWTPPPPQPNQTAVRLHKISSPGRTKGGSFGEFPKGHLRKPSMDSNDSDSWIPETYRNMPRSQIGLNKIEENDAEPWALPGVGAVGQAPGRCNPKRAPQRKSIDIFASEESENAFEDFDDALKNVPVIPIGLRKNRTDPPPVQIEPSLQLDRPQKPIVKQTSLTRQFSDEIEAENLDIDVNKLITQFEPIPPIEIQQIQVMAIVETAQLHYVNTSPTKPQVPNGARLDQLPEFPELQEHHTIVAAPNPCGESIKAARNRRISAKEWASRARVTRSLESGAYASDEIFYSFEKEQHGLTPASPQKRLIRRQVYRIDL